MLKVFQFGRYFRLSKDNACIECTVPAGPNFYFHCTLR
jgi:hypothetical protein